MNIDLRLRAALDEGAILPTRAHAADAGLDLCVPYGEPVRLLRAGSAMTVDTGVHVEIPQGFVGMLKSRSGLNVKYGIINEGVIDSGYTGSIRVKLYNMGPNNHFVHPGDKISQLVILPIITPELELVNELAPTERGENGFGSSGR